MLSARETKTTSKKKKQNCNENAGLAGKVPTKKQADMLTPAKIAQEIRACGYVGQDRAVRAISLFAFRHLDRLARIENGNTENLPKKANMLLIGPTGCGKTYLVELLFKKILKLPTVIADITNYTETGYDGQDLGEILTRLLNDAGKDIKKAETGIVCLDEFDKIANSGGKNYITDAGNNYLKGLGVQRELLKMVEGTNVSVQGSSRKVDINTTGIPFIACGAFSGLKSIIRGGNRNTVGFLQSNNGPKEKIANSYSEDDVNSVTSLQNYGFLPEIIGRFSRIVPFDALGEDEIRSILQQNIIPNWNSEMILHEIDMVVDDSLIEYIVASALSRETGARSVEAVFSQLLEDAAYDAYSSRKAKRLILNLSNGKPVYNIEPYQPSVQSKSRSPLKKLEEVF